MPAPSQTTESPERLAELLDVKTFPPPADFAAKAKVTDPGIYEQAAADAIRACMKWGEQYPAKHDLSSLRLLGTVGEPINPKAWVWYYAVIGGERCPVVDTWWQTETGAS